MHYSRCSASLRLYAVFQKGVLGDMVYAPNLGAKQMMMEVSDCLGLCGAPVLSGLELVSCVALGVSPAFRQLSFSAPPRTFTVLGDAGVVFASQARDNSPSFPSCLKYSFPQT